jgi:pSer/pThr/pTyr-binding forkhead associated (FHA) protein
MPAPSDPLVEGVLTIHLLDTAQGFPIQTWTFILKPQVRIGRAADNEVVITHPYVSRNHVRLVWRDGGWEMENTGSHGTLLRGEKVMQARLAEGDELRLGPLGPTLRFQFAELPESAYGTLAADLPAQPPIRIDPVKKAEEVRAVAESDYFRQLQERVQALRARRG